MNRRYKKAFPISGTPVSVVVDKGLNNERALELTFIDAISLSGYSPDIIKFTDGSGRYVLLKWFDIDEMRY